VSARAISRTGLTLAVIAAICTALVAATYRLTSERIAENARLLLERSLAPALGATGYDGSLTDSVLVLQPPHGLPGNGPATIYRVFTDGRPAAALFVVTAMDGYSGPIRLVVGLDPAGVVTGLRILEHRETPGLGDRIESARSDWVYQFDGRSLGNPEPGRWAIRGDGGDFDQLTGASITPRSVTKAVRDVLLYFAANRDDVFARPATERSQ
jgi:electron transport complex protein RnfG